MIGYSLSIVQKNKEADGKRIGVKLGRVCIKKNIPVRTVAEIAGVSTVTVYGWFSGAYDPKPETLNKLMKRLDRA
jgi:transcriptional regulator with XRE-family HTH domain